MKIFTSPDHALHAPEQELHRGAFVTPHEGTHRMDLLLAGLERAGFSQFGPPQIYDETAIAAVHDTDYLDFLKTAWIRWKEAGYAGDVLPMSYPYRPRRARPPMDIDGAAGFFCASSDSIITRTTWTALLSSANCALSAAQSLSDGNHNSAFALTRPPGHHAGANYMAGYCFLNNSAIAAQYLRDNGAEKVAIIDVDFHHGNGTQDIFYDRADVFFASIHGHPDHHFPYFWGHADETGEGQGEGFTANYPLMPGSGYDLWTEALDTICARTRIFAADALVVSLGVDSFEHDPISSFKLKTPDFRNYGAKIAGLGVPTVFVMEGGYGVPEIGDNTAAVLHGFMDGDTA